MSLFPSKWWTKKCKGDCGVPEPHNVHLTKWGLFSLKVSKFRL